MIDPGALTADITGTVLSAMLPWALWLLLFLWAWERPEEARSAGFGRRTFWLLLPAALLASIANTPILTWAGSVLAMNAGGALIPLLLSALLLHHVVRGRNLQLVAGFFLGSAAVTAALFGLLFLPVGAFGAAGPAAGWLFAPTVPGGAANWLLLAVALSLPLLLAAAATLGATEESRLLARRLAGLSLLTVLALLATYYSSMAVPNQGIESTFPAYLVGPLAVGALAAPLARPLFRLPLGAALSLAYASATVGVLVGADVLREPPLYNGTPAILSIGGAGIGDLVYLTGLLAAGAAFLLVLLLNRSGGAAWGAPPAPEASTPLGLWREALRLHAQGRYREALVRAEGSTHAAGRELELLTGAPPEESAGAWAAVGPAWLEVDRRNLAHLASLGSDDPKESARGLLAARLFVDRAGSTIRSRFATVPRRSAAFALDLLVLTVPAVLLWTALILRSGSSSTLLTGLPFSVAVFGYLGFGFLYFLLSDALWGSSVGKQLLGLRVRDRALARPGLVPALLRSAPKLLPLSLLGEGGAVSLVLLLTPASSPLGPLGPNFGFATGVLLLGATAVGLLLVGLVSAVTILSTFERQRIGDLWAGTWVLRVEAVSVPPGRAAPAPAG
ncbi:MAG: DUF1614 domain-containing protein [Thermoplasmata archaeon]|nr:DUF1614 domain-containing protein [Thermoplasmata archaeon]